MTRLYSKSQLLTKLTRRQREFLITLIDLYKTSGKPVSYKDVAAKIGVSKWTAYDILQELNKKGFLKATYKITSGPGRSEVKFIPKKVSFEHLEESENKSTIVFIKSWIKERLEQYEKQSITKSVAIVERKVEKGKNPFSTVLYTMLLFILFAKVFKIDIEERADIKKLLDSTMQPAVLLPFIGELMFSLAKEEEWPLENLRLNRLTIEKFKMLENKFIESISFLTENEKKKVLTALKELLSYI